MKTDNFYVYELSSAEHVYKHKHLCTPKTRQMKMRVGAILDGSGTFTYVNRKLSVEKGDIVIIPERLFCYSEWIGDPDIHVIYLNFNLNIDKTLSNYDLQAFSLDDPEEQSAAIDSIVEIHRLLQGDMCSRLEAYSKFYTLLATLLPVMENSRRKYSGELCEAIHFISDNWNRDFKFSEVAQHCCSSESKLYKLFKEQLGQSPNDYLNTIKISYAVQYLESAKHSVSAVSRMCNFHSESYFRLVFGKYMGINPSDYKKQFSAL